jgi:hypothetical protein
MIPACSILYLVIYSQYKTFWRTKEFPRGAAPWKSFDSINSILPIVENISQSVYLFGTNSTIHRPLSGMV